MFRLNFSHGTHEDHHARYDTVRQVETETGRPIAILADLQGPKLRIGTFAVGKVAVKAGDSFVLDSDPTPGDATRVYLPHPELFRAASAGQSLLIDDGKVRLQHRVRGERQHHHARGQQRHAVRPQGRQRARTR